MNKAIKLLKHLNKNKPDVLSKLREVKSKAPESMKEDMAMLESQISKVISLERQMIDKESTDVADLHAQIEDLKQKLALGGSDKITDKLEKISFLLSELTARMASSEEIKMQQMKPLREIDEKIAKETPVDERLAMLEAKYQSLKNQPGADKERLQALEARLLRLKSTMQPEPAIMPDQHKLVFPMQGDFERYQHNKGLGTPENMVAPKPDMPDLPESEIEENIITPLPPKRSFMKRLFR